MDLRAYLGKITTLLLQFHQIEITDYTLLERRMDYCKS